MDPYNYQWISHGFPVELDNIEHETDMNSVPCRARGGLSMEDVQGCAECKRLSEAYETETLTWFRLEGHLRIAEYGRDEESAQRIAFDLDDATRRRTELRNALARHKQDFHGGGSTSRPCVMSAR